MKIETVSIPRIEFFFAVCVEIPRYHNSDREYIFTNQFQKKRIRQMEGDIQLWLLTARLPSPNGPSWK